MYFAWLPLLSPGNAQSPEGSKIDRASKEFLSHFYEQLTRLTLALREFDDKHGHLPRKAIRSNADKPVLSWRVALLPFLGHKELHDQFHFDEPWDSEHNSKLISRMPDDFAVDPGEGPAPDASAGKTRIVLPVLDGSLWYGDDNRLPRIKDVTDGTAFTMGLLVAPPEAAVIWTKPEDFLMKTPHEMFGDNESCFVTTLDGARYRLSSSASRDDLHSLLTYDAGDAVDWTKLLRSR